MAEPMEWVTVKEASELTGYSPWLFYKLRKLDRIDSIKRGNVIFFPKEAVVEYANKMDELGKSKHAIKY